MYSHSRCTTMVMYYVLSAWREISEISSGRCPFAPRNPILQALSWEWHNGDPAGCACAEAVLDGLSTQRMRLPRNTAHAQPGCYATHWLASELHPPLVRHTATPRIIITVPSAAHSRILRPVALNDVQRSWTKLTHGRLAQLSAYNESQLIIRPDIPPSACVRAPRKMARSTKAFDA